MEGEVDLSRLMQDIPAVEDLLESEDDAPIIRMINALLTQAAREGASDIHIEPFETSSVVRFRVDGTLRDVVRPKKALHGALISRIKIMAQLDIAEKRLPQDGRITLRVGGTSGGRARVHAADRPWRARGAASARQGSGPAATSKSSAWRATRWSSFDQLDRASRTASCW